VGWLLYSVHLKKFLQQGKAGKIKLALITLGLIFLVLAVTGRAHALFAIIGAAMTQVMRFIPLLMKFAPSFSRYFGGLNGVSGAGGASGSSTVRTDTLLMSLNHSSGDISAQVINGPFQGQELAELSIADLMTLGQYCDQHDPEALRLLQSYIQRHRYSEWQANNPDQDGESGGESGGAGNKMTNSSTMTVEEACQILGIGGDTDITRESITTAHRSLMGQFHPDKGGSDYLAMKINSAKEVLLNHIKTK